MLFRPIRRGSLLNWEVTTECSRFYLTSQQGLVLALLSVRPGALVTRDMLDQALWGDLEDGGPNDSVSALNVVVAKVRERLAAAAALWAIETHSGQGFRLTRIEHVRGNQRWTMIHKQAIRAAAASHAATSL